MPNLYPNVTLPTLVTPTSRTEQKLMPAPKFDWLTGDFILDGAGRMCLADPKESFESWILKICQTERGTRLAYSDVIGVEIESALKLTSPEAAKSAIIRTLTEAIMVHPAVEYVKNFKFTGDADELRITFSVKAKNFPEESNFSVVY